MNGSRKSLQPPDFVKRVRNIIDTVVENVSRSFGCTVALDTLLPGRMLRTAFASRLLECGGLTVETERLASACAATELVHTASLCHDDVIDNGLIRRGIPTLWRTTTPSCSVLIGDVLLSESLYLLLQTFESRCVRHFVSKVREVCMTEIEQEIIWRGQQADESVCMRIARGKTGPLFGFVGYAAGGKEVRLSSSLEEAGYCIGTAYQLFDDLLDVTGTESIIGKTLRSDVRRGKVTMPQLTGNAAGIINSKILELCSSALECVQAWPEAQKGIEEFFKLDLQPAFDRIQSGIQVVS